jgi:hypothetical protein
MNSKRIKWLEKAYQIMRRDFLPEVPEIVTITTTAGFPSRRGAGTIGECIHNYIQKSNDTQHLITIHFKQFSDPVEVLHVLLHEVIHASGISGHGKEFSQKAKNLGLLKPWVATTPGEELKAKLIEIAKKIGDMPDGHGEDNNSKNKKQKSRNRLYKCSCNPVVKIRAGTDHLHAQCLACGDIFKLAV